MSLAGSARVTLAGVRLVNGTLGLVAPQVLARRLGADPKEHPELLYALRMFGVRTVVIAIELLRNEPAALRKALPIHASDTVAAILLARELPRKQAAVVVGISATNTALALLIRRA
jgi:hypothetical protein